MRRIRPSTARCAVCERPAPRASLTCAYCGEDLPWRRHRLIRRAVVAFAAVLSTTAFIAIHGLPAMPESLSLPGSMLVALGTGLMLLPPPRQGVANDSRAERLRQMLLRCAGGAGLTILTALAAWSTSAHSAFPPADMALALVTAALLVAAPPLLDLPWHRLASGLLLAAGAIISSHK